MNYGIYRTKIFNNKLYKCKNILINYLTLVFICI